jgi:hypothetical protein
MAAAAPRQRQQMSPLWPRIEIGKDWRTHCLALRALPETPHDSVNSGRKRISHEVLLECWASSHRFPMAASCVSGMKLFSRKGHVFQSDARTRSHSQRFAKRTLLVHLDAGKAFRAEPEPLLLRGVAVEAVAPAFVIPADGADLRFANHYSQSKLAFHLLNASSVIAFAVRCLFELYGRLITRILHT